MSKWIKYLVKSFADSNIESIQELILEYYQRFIRSMLNSDYNEINKLVDISCEVRDNIEDDTSIERNKEFYFGYLYACEDIGRKIYRQSELNQNVNLLVETNEKLRKLVKFLGVEKAARQKDIAEHLEIKANELANFMDTEYVKKADILSKDTIGRNVIYSLNHKGRKYFEEKLSEKQKSYGRADILKMIDYFIENRGKSFEILSKESPLLDEAIFSRMYSLIISEEIVTNSKLKNKIYINDENKKQVTEKKITAHVINMFAAPTENANTSNNNGSAWAV